MSSDSIGLLSDEDDLPRHKKIEHDLRNVRSTRAVYGAGLTATGCFGVASLIQGRRTPGILYKPLRIAVLNSKKIRKVAAGFGFSLFASSTALYGAGLNNFHQLGDYKSDKINDQHITNWYIKAKRIILPEGENIIDISSGRLHSLIATTSGLYSLGDNAHGQCGQNPVMYSPVTHSKNFKWMSVEIPSDLKVKKVHCSLDTSFVLMTNGDLYAFGLSTDGQLGNGNNEYQWIPKLVEGDLKGENITHITGSTDTLLAISSNGDLFAWGQNEYGQLTTVSEEPQVLYPRYMPFKNIGKIVSAAASGSSCIICNSDGNVFTWGTGILGFGPKMTELKRPMLLDPPLFASAIGDEGKVKWVYAGNTMMGAVTEVKHIFTWGSNLHGNLGIGHGIPATTIKTCIIWAQPFTVSHLLNLLNYVKFFLNEKISFEVNFN